VVVIFLSSLCSRESSYETHYFKQSFTSFLHPTIFHKFAGLTSYCKHRDDSGRQEDKWKGIEQSRAGQGRAEIGRAGQRSAEQDRIEQGRSEQSRAEQSRAEQSRAEHSKAEQSRAEHSKGFCGKCSKVV
jgi:hypothetical protein